MSIRHLTLMRMTYSDRNGKFVDQYNVDTCMVQGSPDQSSHHNFMVTVDSELGGVIDELETILREHLAKQDVAAKVE